MSGSRDQHDPAPRRDEGMGLLALVVTILAGTAWTVGSFVESSALPARAEAPSIAGEATASSCDGVECDDRTLTPTPGWHSAGVSPNDLLRTDAADDAARRLRRLRGATESHWGRVSAPEAALPNG